MSRETILLVDDEPHIIELVQMYLQKEGYTVLSAGDGERALQTIAAMEPELIVLDLMLPKVDGWEVCRQVRAESDVPIIMLTARDEAVDKIVGLELGADAYLTKPFNPRELVAWVKAVLRRATAQTKTGAADSQAISVGRLEICAASREVRVNDELVALRAKEDNSARSVRCLCITGYIQGYSSKVVAKINHPSLRHISKTTCAANVKTPPSVRNLVHDGVIIMMNRLFVKSPSRK